MATIASQTVQRNKSFTTYTSSQANLPKRSGYMFVSWENSSGESFPQQV